MKTAHCKYNFANQEMIVDVYFEPKAFDLILPTLTNEAQDDLIRKICDSMANAMPKDNLETRYYVKKVFQELASSKIKLLCTDGFLVDSTLVIALNQQPFSKERISITDVDQVPSRFRLSNEILKTLNDRLPWFEEEVRKSNKLTTPKEIPKAEKRLSTSRNYILDRTADIISEIGVMKKEIIEISKSRSDSLKKMMEQGANVRKRIYNDIVKEMNLDLKKSENKTKYEEVIKTIIAQFSEELDNKITLTNTKINEITPISTNFESEIEEICQQISKQTGTLIKFKELIIENLYHSAKEYAGDISKQLQNAAPNARKMMINDFNRKFESIASLSESGELNSLDETYENLNKLTLENLQDIISNEDKANLGLLQKCNTSWTEESHELQIVLKNLGKLNQAYKSFFQADPIYSKFFNQDMVQIIRTPFPRSFQFKFTQYAFDFRKMVDDFCKSKKETIVNMAKEYKKKMQLDDVIDKTNRAMKEVDNVAISIKKAVLEYKDFLTQIDTSDEIMEAADKDYVHLEESFNTAKQIQEFILHKVDDRLKRLKKKMNTHIDDIHSKFEMVQKIILRMKTTQKQISAIVTDYHAREQNTGKYQEVNEKIKLLREDRNKIAALTTAIDLLNQKFTLYNQVAIASEKTTVYDFNEIRRQQSEAKNLVAQLIRNEATKMSEERRKQIVNLYSQIETSILKIDKINQETEFLKNQLFAELNKVDLPDELFKDRFQMIQDKFNETSSIEKQISDDLSQLKRM